MCSLDEEEKKPPATQSNLLKMHNPDGSLCSRGDVDELFDCAMLKLVETFDSFSMFRTFWIIFYSLNCTSNNTPTLISLCVCVCVGVRLTTLSYPVTLLLIEAESCNYTVWPITTCSVV